MAYRLRRNLFDYDYDYEDELVLRSQLLYPVAPVVVAPVVPVWFVGIDPAYYSIMSWMNSILFQTWQEWQDNIRGENFSPEQRKTLLRKMLHQRNTGFPPWPASELERWVERFIAMEPELGADQYGHVNTAAPNPAAHNATSSSNLTSTMITTTTLTTQQRNDADQLYLQSLNGTNTDPARAQQTYQQIISGQSDQLAEHFLQTKPRNAVQQNVMQQMPPPQIQQSRIQAPQLQQQQIQPQQIQYQQGQLQPIATQQSTQQQHVSQQVPMHQPPQNVRYAPQQASGRRQPQNASQQMLTTTTTTTTTSTNSFNVFSQQMPKGHQHPMQTPQPMQQVQGQARPQITAQSQRPALGSRRSSSTKEQKQAEREARKASRNAKK